MSKASNLLAEIDDNLYGYIISADMYNYYLERTERHIALVRKYCKILAQDERFTSLIGMGSIHDISKLNEPEFTPYILITWGYKMKDMGTPIEYPDYIKRLLTKATEHHVKTNSHHPEYHSSDVAIINREDRDVPPAKIVDATSMDDLSIAEMVADWLAMSEERSTDPYEWADKNINVRWKFTNNQVALIYELIDLGWKTTHSIKP